MALPILFRSTPFRALRARPARAPFGRLSAEIDTLFDEMLRTALPVSSTASAFSPSVDLVEAENELRISVELPGLRAEDVHVEAKDGVLRIYGEKASTASEEKTNWHRAERSYGSFERRIRVPARFDADAASAAMEHGVLTVTLPVIPAAQPREIAVEAGE